MNAQDAITLAALSSLVRYSNDKFPRQAQKLYAGAADGYGYGSTNEAAYQVIRQPLLETTLPLVENPGEPHPLLSFPDPKPLTITARTYRGAVQNLWEIEVDDKWGYFKRQLKAFGTSLARTEELAAMEIFNRALDPSFTSGWDNLPLGHDAHLLAGGGTYSNVLPAQPPSEALKETILEYFNNVPSEYGWPQPVDRITIITGEGYAYRWKQLLGSDVAFTHPFSAADPNQNPAIPQLAGDENSRFRIISAVHLEDPTIQIILGSGHELLFKRRWQYNETTKTSNPRGYLTTAGTRLMTGWGDARLALVVKN